MLTRCVGHLRGCAGARDALPYQVCAHSYWPWKSWDELLQRRIAAPTIGRPKQTMADKHRGAEGSHDFYQSDTGDPLPKYTGSQKWCEDW